MRRPLPAEMIDKVQLITARQLAEMLGVHPCTVKRNVKENPKFPRPVRLSGERLNAPVRFIFTDVEKWLQSVKASPLQ